jgi:hypothetical protein
MPKSQTEDDKKHGDKLQSLIDRERDDEPQQGEEGDDAEADLQDDEDEDEDEDEDDVEDDSHDDEDRD